MKTIIKIQISKKDYQELRQVLSKALDFNQKGTRLQTIKSYTDGNPRKLINARKPTIDDYLEMNQDSFVQICDLLGLSDIYLNSDIYLGC